MSYVSLGEVQTSVCTSDAHCGGGYICCQGTCATADETICADHPGYQSRYEAPPATTSEYQPPAPPPPTGRPAAVASTSGAGKVLLAAALVGIVVGGGMYAWHRKKGRR